MTSDRENATDPHDLDRFIQAQRNVYDQALAEIRSGHKRSHWMWFIFPQYAGLGSSPMSQQYAIKSLGEAEAYLQHPVLGPRLVECVEALLRIEDRSASEVFGTPDDMKLRSSATLFSVVTPAGSVFERLLDKYFDGQRDQRTLQLVAGGSQPRAEL